MSITPILLTDFYKTIHHMAYVEGLDYLVSYWTPRMSRVEGTDKIVMFGLQAFIKKYLITEFNTEFFNKSKEEVVKEYKEFITFTMTEQASDTTHIEQLHDLGYLPIKIKAIAEGTRVNIKTPIFEISNTLKGYGWLVNYIETLVSVNVWHPLTSATTAFEYRQLVNEYYTKTVCIEGLEQKAVGDFSMRGMSSPEGAMASGGAHLTSFTGTATMSAILWLKEYYNADYTKELVGKGVPSTEHSVMSSYGKAGEFACYKRLFTEVFPTGLLSVVSDTYDYWNVLTNYLPKLKEEILARDGKIIIRGDSGDPIDILCGTSPFGTKNATPEQKGTVEILWDIFGGIYNAKGYKVLNPHIGAIYGDSITPVRAREIYKRLESKGFASSNVILGAGSYTYQFVTRDTYGQALKATHSVVNGVERQIYKDPKTDNDSFKKSQRGLCYVYRDGDDILYKDELSFAELEQMKDNLLIEVFKDGHLVIDCTLKEIRARLHQNKF